MERAKCKKCQSPTLFVRGRLLLSYSLPVFANALNVDDYLMVIPSGYELAVECSTCGATDESTGWLVEVGTSNMTEFSVKLFPECAGGRRRTESIPTGHGC